MNKAKDSSRFGKSVEYKIIGELLAEGIDVYVPLVDNHGVDAVIKRSNGTFVEVQIKGRSEDAKNMATFANIKVHSQLNDENKNNFFYIFRSEKLGKTWVLNFKEFNDNSSEIKSGKNKGHRTIKFSTKKGKEIKGLSKYEIKNFNIFY